MRARPAEPHRPRLGRQPRPEPQSTPRFLHLLAEPGTDAPFFLLGQQAHRFPGLVREIAAAGHEIGIHGWLHRPLVLCGPRATYDDLARARDNRRRHHRPLPHRLPASLRRHVDRRAPRRPTPRAHSGAVDVLGPRTGVSAPPLAPASGPWSTTSTAAAPSSSTPTARRPRDPGAPHGTPCPASSTRAHTTASTSWRWRITGGHRRGARSRTPRADLDRPATTRYTALERL
ncbi:polysaccharide deacetylase family protein [Streptomyces sp. NPDC052192]|uniref:polysaccharide deacetylase family protein n=1 Tax=Streptomyces sp. NPDC052192 TaxID=3155052 RepID=UPI00344999DA